jgi:hypothetical protein
VLCMVDTKYTQTIVGSYNYDIGFILSPRLVVSAVPLQLGIVQVVTYNKIHSRVV